VSFLSELRRRNVFRVAIAYSVTAWLVAQVAELALDSFGTPEWVMKTLLLILVLGLPFAVLFAWAYEMTPDGLKRERDVDRSASITQQTGKKINFAIIGALALALAISLWTRDWSDTSVATTDGKSIAVLPFVNMSDDVDNEYFSDGISEELLNVLVKVEGLRVASRTSSFSFKGKETSIPDIANALKVEHVLEGSVRKAGDTIRITAQLIDAKTDRHLWSETYDRKLEDIFVIQDEISAHIVEALKIALGAGEIVRTSTNPTENLEAYEDYLRGQHFWQRRGGENIRKAIELFRQATQADPGFARAWSSLAAAHLTMPTYSGEPEDSHFPLALEYANKALALDPALAEAHAVIADLNRFEKRWIEAEAHYLKAIELEPSNSTGYLWYSEQMATVGYSDKALRQALIAYEFDPFNPGANSMVAFGYEATGDTRTAIKRAQAAWDLGHPGSYFQILEGYLTLQDFAEAQRLIDRNTGEFGPEMLAELKLYVDAIRDPQKADAFLSAVADAPDYSSFERGLDRIRFGHVNEGIQLITQAAPDGQDWMVLWLPRFADLRRSPGFVELVRQSGLVDYWDKFGWPSHCTRDGETIRCH
jgi:TolB-like protein